MSETDETVPEIIWGVFAAGALPIARSLPALWRWAGRHPLRIALALLATPVIALGLVVYLLCAMVVPLSFGCVLLLALPVMAYLAVARQLGRATSGRADL